MQLYNPVLAAESVKPCEHGVQRMLKINLRMIQWLWVTYSFSEAQKQLSICLLPLSKVIMNTLMT